MAQKARSERTRRVARELQRLLADRRGLVQLEYILAVTFIGLATVAALALAAPRLVHHFSTQRAMLYRAEP